MFLSDLVAQANAQAKATGYPMDQRLLKKAWQLHGLMYSRLTDKEKEVYALKGAQVSVRREAEEQAKQDGICSWVDLQSRRAAAAEALLGVPLRVAQCYLTLTDFQLMCDLWNGDAFSERKLESMRSKAVDAPAQPVASLQRQLEAVYLDEVEVDKGSPEWARGICRERQAFKGAALVFQPGTSDEKAFAFLFAFQSPMQAMFLELQSCRRPAGRVVSGLMADFLAEAAGHFKWEFQVIKKAYFWQWELPKVAVEEVFVLPFLMFAANGVVVSEADLQPLADWVAQAPQAQRSTASAEKATSSVDFEGPLEQGFPYLQEYMQMMGKKGQSSTQAPSSSSSSEEEEVADEATEQKLMQAAEELAFKRAEWSSTLEDQPTLFQCTVRGGQWTLENKGVAFDSILTEARKVTWPWCERYGMPKRSTYAFKLYGQRLCTALAMYWCKRMQALYDIWVANGSEMTFKYRPDHIQSLLKPKEVEGVLAGEPAAHPGWKRLQGIQALSPG